MKRTKKLCILALASIFCIGTTVLASWTSVTKVTVPQYMGQVSTSKEPKTDSDDSWSFRPVLMNTGINTALYDVNNLGTQASERLTVNDSEDDLQYALHSYYYSFTKNNYYKQIINSQTSNWTTHDVHFYWSPDYKTFN